MALTPEDFTEQKIRIRDGKTQSAWRVIPLHPTIRDFHAWIHDWGMAVFEGARGDRVRPVRQNFAKLIRSHLEQPIEEPRKGPYTNRR